MYRILTEYKNTRAVEAAVSRYFPGFTIFKARSLEGRGIWERQAEHSLILEIDTKDEEAVKKAALDIKALNKQKTVMIQRIPNEVWFI